MPRGAQAGRIELPAKLIPVFEGKALFRGAYGGRGSAKTRSFATMAAVHALRCAQAGEAGVVVCGREFQNSLDDSSMAEVRAAIESMPWLAAGYDIGEKYIRTRDGRVEFLFVGLRRNVESVKSTSRIRLLWVDEAEPVSESSWQKVIPTVREPNAEIWVTWNPERRGSATNQRFRENPPKDSKIVSLNWRDNPFFPSVLDALRREDLEHRPSMYPWVWEGEFATAHAGAYYALLLSQAKTEGRIGNVGKDPLLPIRVCFDLGGSGNRSDATACWVVQWVSREIRVLDYYEAVGEPLATHIAWLRERGWDKAEIILPHDGATFDRVYSVSFEQAFWEAGFNVTVVPNQGRGAAKARIEAARRLFPICHFNEKTTENGRDALGWYHEKKSEDARDVGLGPEHDWSSHCFIKETAVLTRFGTCQIKDLPFDGEVLTRCGWKRYRNPRMTRQNAPLVEVTFRGGYTVRCTPDHLFATASGWISAEHLLPGTEIQFALMSGRSTGMAGSTGFGRARNTFLAARQCIGGFIGLSGRLRSGRSLRDAISTIVTATNSTMSWPIWSVSPSASTSVRLGTLSGGISRRESISVTRRVGLPPNGTQAQRAVHGTASTQPSQRAGSSGSASGGNACNAAASSMLSSARGLWFRFIASLSARLRRIGNKIVRTNGPPIIARVRRLSETADVWDLTVPGVAEFSLANGAIVHNCADAFGLMAVAYEAPRGRPKKLQYATAAAGFV